MDDNAVNTAISAYVIRGVPFLLKGATKGWKAHKKWTKTGIKKHYGKANINLKRDNWQYMATCKASTSNFKGEEDGTIEDLIDVFDSLFPKDNLPKPDFRPPYMFSMSITNNLPKEFFTDFKIPGYFFPGSKVNWRLSSCCTDPPEYLLATARQLGRFSEATRNPQNNNMITYALENPTVPKVTTVDERKRGTEEVRKRNGQVRRL